MLRRLLLGLLAICLAAAAARADERITSFTSDATVETSGDLLVRETIAWTFSGVGPKRGLLRDFPISYRDRNGIRVNVGFTVLSVTRDGRDEPYAVESIGNGKRVRIGQADVFLPEGRHIYEIAYRTSRQIGFFDDYDEIYWNVTGNAWSMPIDRADAIIRLPAGARVIRHAAYTGPEGTAGSDYRVTAAEAGRYEARTTRTLAPGEGFTVAVAFTKGIVAPPGEGDRLRWFIEDNAPLAVLAASLAIVFGYFLWAWFRVGRDPPAGVVIPLFSPPPGLGAAGLRYVWKQGFDDKTFSAALVDLAVKGRLRIIDDDGDFAIEKHRGGSEKLLAGESALYAAMPEGTTEFETSNHRRVAAMRSALQKALSKEFDGSAFVRNVGWSLIGLALSVAGLVLAALLLPGEEAATGLFMAVWVGIWWAGTLTGLLAAVRGLYAHGLVRKAGAIMKILFLVPFVLIGTVAPLLILAGVGSFNLMALAAAGLVMVVLNVVFFRLMSAPTAEGQQLLDRIRGFRMYMTTAEEDRLNSLNPPEKTPELFEKYLPYAIALDCENEWADKFTAILAAAGVAAPAWYAGSHWNNRDLGGFTDSLGSSLASSTAAAATPPGSSSGSGGGGSSGGGGGGGGGSSW
jgi:uncharacterized membrane protein YgcG